jgi:two-component system response regulator YesN
MKTEILVMDCEERGTFWLTLKSDHRILFATTGQEGLEMLSENVGLVFLSLALRDTDSMEMLGLITREYPSTAVVVVAPCGTGEPCMCMEAFKRGARDYIRKPLMADVILGKIELLLTGRDGFRERREVPSPAETVHCEQYPDIPSHLVDGVLKVRDFVAQNYSESLSLTAACKMAALSKTYFCRFFKDITGHSLRSYHHAVRVRMAEQLLSDKKLSVTDVAIQLGYNDSNYFSTIYKKITGISPRTRKASDQYLEKNREVLNRF